MSLLNNPVLGIDRRRRLLQGRTESQALFIGPAQGPGEAIIPAECSGIAIPARHFDPCAGMRPVKFSQRSSGCAVTFAAEPMRDGRHGIAPRSERQCYRSTVLSPEFRRKLRVPGRERRP
jgi:hypothetical protein